MSFTPDSALHAHDFESDTPTSAVATSPRKRMQGISSTASKSENVPPRRPLSRASATKRSAPVTKASTPANPLAASTTRTNLANSINKPPVRPPVTTASRRSLGSTKTASDHEGLSAVSEDEKQKVSVNGASRRLSALPTPAPKPNASNVVSTGARRPIRTPAESSAMRPTIASRASATSPTKVRLPASSTKKPAASDSAKSPVTPTPRTSTASTARTSVTAKDLSPEQREPDRPSSEESAAPAPTPTLPLTKAASDAEFELSKGSPSELPTTLPKHSRSKSRPMNVPSSAASAPDADDEATKQRRSMEVMQQLFHESTAREALKEQIKELQEEIARMERQRAAGGSKTSEADIEKVVMELADKHASELRALRAELDTKKALEHEVESVKKLLEEARSAMATQAAKHKAESEKRDEGSKALVLVIEDLKKEIDRVENQLEVDSQAQKEEASQAAETIKSLRDELQKTVQSSAEERRRNAEAAKSYAEAVESLQADVERLHSGNMEELRRRDQALEDAKSLHEDLKKEMEELRQRHQFELSQTEGQAQNSKERLKSLQKEMESLQQLRTGELQVKDNELAQKDNELAQRHEAIKGLQDHIRKLQNEESDGSKIVETLQEEIKRLQQAQEDLSDQRYTEVSALNSTVDELKAEIQSLKEHNTNVERQKEEEAATLNQLVERLKGEIQELQEQDHESTRSHREEVNELSKVIETLQGEIATWQQQAVDAQQASQEETERLGQVVRDLEDHLQLQQLQQEQALNSVQAKEVELNGTKEVVDQLQEQIKALLQDKNDATEKHQAAMDQLQSLIGNLQDDLKDMQTRNADNEMQYTVALAKAKEELDAAMDRHSNELQRLEDDHAAEVEALEADLESKRKQLLETLMAGSAALDREKTAADKERDEAIERVRNEMTDHYSKLIDKVQANQEAQLEIIDRSNAKAHAESLERLRIDMQKQQDRAVQEMQTIINAMVSERKELNEAHDAALADVRASVQNLLDEKEALQQGHDAAMRTLQDELHKTRRQLSDEHHYQILQFQQQIEELEKRNESLLQDNGDLEGTQAALADLLSRYDALEAEKSAGSVNDIELAELKAKYDALEAERSAWNETNTALAELRFKYDALADEAAMKGMDLKKALKDLREEHDAMDVKKRDLELSYMHDLEELKQQHRKAVEDLAQQHELRVSSMRVEIETACSQMISDVDKARAGVITELQRQLDAAKVELLSARNDFTALKAAADDAERHLSQLAELTEQNTLLNAELKKVQQAHNIDTDQVGLLNAAVLAAEEENSKLEVFLADANAHCMHLEEVAATHEGMKEELEDARNRVSELQVQLKAVLAELTELRDKPPSLFKLSLSPPRSSDTNRWTGESPPAYDDPKPNGTTNGNPTADDDDSEQVTAGAEQSAGVSSEPISSHEWGAGFSLEGTLASLRVQAKQLEELNEDLLGDNVRMLKTLETTAPSAGSSSEL